MGDVVGRYRITDVLGRGGMGVVFAAMPEDVERPVALKVLAPEAAGDPGLRERFAREAATLARLDSPHIVYIVEYGEHDGCPYLVTQLVPGDDLRRRLGAGPLPPRQAADVLVQVAEALEEAHSRGVVHRDLKPANVLLRTLPGGELHAYLCDFGIARADNQETTSASGVLGTLEYLAPERQSGSPASVATDVYSLGCLLWAAATAAPPYRGSDVDVALAHLRAPVPELPGDDPVSRRINQIVARAMAKKPTERYPSAQEMRQELVALRVLAAAHEGTASPAAAPRRRRGRLALASGVLAAVAAITAAFWLASMLRGDDPLSGDDPPAPRESEPVVPRRCWDGSVAEPADCPTPTGVSGLLWAFPTFDKERPHCHEIKRPLSPRKVRGYFCPFTLDNPAEGLRYSEWVSAAAAREVINRDFNPWREAGVEKEGYTWSVWVRESGDEQGFFSSAIAYRDWPFSAEVVSNTKDASIVACNDIELRAPTSFQPVSGLCRGQE